MKKLILLFAMALAAYAASAQSDIATTSLTWTVGGLKDNNTNKEQAYTCTFKTGTAGTIEWVQSNNYTIVFTVTSTSGSWTNVNATGQYVYNVSVDGETGTLTFEKTGGSRYVTIDLSEGTGTRLKHRYTVTGVE